MTLLDDAPLNGTFVLGQPGTPGPAGPTGPAGAGVPNGGTSGQVLAKNSATNQDTHWVDAGAGGSGVPAGGTTGQVLTKLSSTDGDADWEDPTGGGGGLVSVSSSDSATIDFSGLGTSGTPLTASIVTGSISTGMLNFDVATQAELDAHVTDTTAAHAASSLSFAPTGTISSTTVQAAIAEVSGDVDGLPTLTTSDTSKVPIATASGVTTLDVTNLLSSTSPANFTKMMVSGQVAGGGFPALVVKHELDARTAGTTGGAGIEIYVNPSHSARTAFFHYGGTAGAPAQTPTAANLGGLTWRGSTDGTAFSAAAACSIICATDEAVTSTNKGAHMDLVATPVGSGGVAGAVLRLQSTTGYDATIRGALRVGGGATLAAPSTGYAFESITAGNGIGYGTGAGTAVTQGTSRTTAVTANTVTGAVTLFAAAPAVGTWTTFVVNNTAVRSTDTIRVTCASCNAANKYIAHAGTIVNATSFEISVTTIVGTTSDSPVFNFTIFRGASA
jgi:hypothetical protein